MRRSRDTSHANDARIAHSVGRDDRRLYSARRRCRACRLTCRPIESQNTDLSDKSIAITDPDVVRSDRRRRTRELKASAGFPIHKQLVTGSQGKSGSLTELGENTRIRESVANWVSFSRI